jgi:hypothetical protein
MIKANKTLHLTAIPLRFIAAGELCRSTLRPSIVSCSIKLLIYSESNDANVMINSAFVLVGFEE